MTQIDIPIGRVAVSKTPPTAFQRPDSPQPHLALYRRIATVFGVLTVIVIGLAVYVIMGSATVVVMSKPEEARTEFQVNVARQPADGEIMGGMFEATQEVSKEFDVTATTKAEAKAEGRVKIASRLNRDQQLIATTRLLTADGKLYRLKDDVTVPANGSAEVGAVADVAGAAYETAEMTFIIPGLKDETRALFVATVVQPFVGGLREGKFVNQADIDAALVAMRGDVEAALLTDVRSQSQQAGIAAAGEVVTTAMDGYEVTPPLDTVADKFTVKAKAKATALVYDKAALSQMTEGKIREALAFDRKYVRLVDDGLVTVEKTDHAANRATLKVIGKAVSTLSPDTPALTPEQFAGVTLDAAREYLNKIGGVMSVSFEISPAWSKRLPASPERIKVEVR